MPLTTPCGSAPPNLLFMMAPVSAANPAAAAAAPPAPAAPSAAPPVAFSSILPVGTSSAAFPKVVGTGAKLTTPALVPDRKPSNSGSASNFKSSSSRSSSSIVNASRSQRDQPARHEPVASVPDDGLATPLA